MSRTIKDPIPVAPFLAWAARREAQILRELDAYPAITRRIPLDAHARLVADIGWDADAGARRLHRWAHPEQGEGHSGFTERALIEDALDHAGVVMSTVYPDLVDTPLGSPRLGVGAHMTQVQLLAAHTIYTRGRLTMAATAELIWERYGFANPESARCALKRGWSHLDVETRQCAAVAAGGERCRNHPASGSDFCDKHPVDAPLGWQPSTELVGRAREMYEDGTSFKRIGVALCDVTPWRHPTYVAKRFAAIARAVGWNKSPTGVRPPLASIRSRDDADTWSVAA